MANYLNNYNINQRFGSFRNITHDRAKLFEDKFDYSNVVLENQRNAEALHPKSTKGLRFNNDDIISSTPLTNNNDVNIYNLEYTREREMIEEELRHLADKGEEQVRPRYMLMKPSDKLKIMDALNGVILYQKQFFTRSMQDSYNNAFEFFPKFNAFSGLYQSFHDQIKNDPEFAEQFKNKCIVVENLLEKSKQLYTNFGLPHTGQHYALTALKNYLADTYSLEYIAGLFNDALQIVKQMIKLEGVSAYLNNANASSYGTIQPQPFMPTPPPPAGAPRPPAPPAPPAPRPAGAPAPRPAGAPAPRPLAPPAPPADDGEDDDDGLEGVDAGRLGRAGEMAVEDYEGRDGAEEAKAEPPAEDLIRARYRSLITKLKTYLNTARNVSILDIQRLDLIGNELGRLIDAFVRGPADDDRKVEMERLNYSVVLQRIMASLRYFVGVINPEYGTFLRLGRDERGFSTTGRQILASIDELLTNIPNIVPADSIPYQLQTALDGFVENVTALRRGIDEMLRDIVPMAGIPAVEPEPTERAPRTPRRTPADVLAERRRREPTPPPPPAPAEEAVFSIPVVLAGKVLNPDAELGFVYSKLVGNRGMNAEQQAFHATLTGKEKEFYLKMMASINRDYMLVDDENGQQHWKNILTADVAPKTPHLDAEKRFRNQWNYYAKKWVDWRRRAGKGRPVKKVVKSKPKKATKK